MRSRLYYGLKALRLVLEKRSGPDDSTEEHNRYREQIGAFLLGKLDEGERTALQEHLNSCPVCQAEERELEPVVAAPLVRRSRPDQR